MLVYFSSSLIFSLLISIVQPAINVLDKGILPLEENSVALQFFIDIENDCSGSSCDVISRCAKCCIPSQVGEDCSTIEAYGENYDHLPSKDRRSLLFIYPTIQQYNQIGYCDFFLDYNCDSKNTQRKRLVVGITFDTRLYRSRFNSNANILRVYKEEKPKYCNNRDQDPLNNCLPVNCDWCYNGNRPFYDRKRNTCTEAPFCVSDVFTEDTTDPDLPDTAYVSTSNVCRNLRTPLTYEDIYAFNSGGTLTFTTPKNAIQEAKKPDSLSRFLTLLSKSPIDSCKTKWSKLLLHTFTSIMCICAVIMTSCCCLKALVILLTTSKRRLKKYYKRYKKSLRAKCKIGRSTKSHELTDELLKKVICRDLPEQYLDDIKLCDRMSRRVKWKKRYRMEELGSQVSLDTRDAAIINSDETSLSSSEDAERIKFTK